MKKLSKKVSNSFNTVEAFQQSSCSCSCRCSWVPFADVATKNTSKSNTSVLSSQKKKKK